MTYDEQIVDLIKGGGCFVSTKIGMYRANKTLTAEELGIGEIPKSLMTMARIKLLPDEICPEMKLIRSIENRVNGLVNLSTFDFEGFGKYLKNSASAEFAIEIQSLQDEYFDVVDSFVENYQTYIDASVELWSEQAEKFIPEEKQDDEDFCDEFKDNFANAIRDSFIGPSQLRDKFKFKATYLQIPDPAKDAWENSEAEYAAMSAEFVEMTMKQLRSEAFTALESISESVNSGKFTQKAFNMIPKLLDRIDQMQIVEDEVLVDRVQLIREEIMSMKAADYKKSGSEEALKSMRDGLTKAVDDLRVLSEEDLKESIEKKFTAGGGRRIAEVF